MLNIRQTAILLIASLAVILLAAIAFFVFLPNQVQVGEAQVEHIQNSESPTYNGTYIVTSAARHGTSQDSD